MTKKITIEIDEDGDIHFNNDGFVAVELIGLCEVIKSRALKDLNKKIEFNEQLKKLNTNG